MTIVVPRTVPINPEGSGTPWSHYGQRTLKGRPTSTSVWSSRVGRPARCSSKTGLLRRMLIDLVSGVATPVTSTLHIAQHAHGQPPKRCTRDVNDLNGCFRDLPDADCGIGPAHPPGCDLSPVYAGGVGSAYPMNPKLKTCAPARKGARGHGPGPGRIALRPVQALAPINL